MKNKNNHIYKLRYKIETEAGKFSADSAKEDGDGLTDALLLVSMIEAEDGSYSQCFFSHDGRTNKDITDDKLFKAWTMIGMHLADNGRLNGWKKSLVETFANTLRDYFCNKRGTH